MPSDYFPIHAHSEFSVLDGIGSVADMVARVESLNQPGIALTDHGTVAGCIRLYKEAKKHGLAPFPGAEFYLVRDATPPDPKPKKGEHDPRDDRYHLGIVALTERGWRALVQLSSRSFHRDRFHRKPLIDLGDLAALSQAAAHDVAITTGCYFGWIVQHHLKWNRDIDRTAKLVKQLAGWFPHTFIEVQNHEVVHDDGLFDSQISGDLFKVADIVGLPVVLGQDSHYCEQWNQDAHDMMKEICYFGDGEDYAFPGGPYHLASAKWLSKKWAKDEWSRIDEGHSALLDLNRLVLPALDKYKFHVPDVKGTGADRWLKNMVDQAMYDRGLDKWGTYPERAKQELSVMKKMGMANYFLLMEDICSWCRSEGIFINARGSANGSLVCYVLGITNVDPILWDTDFDRFISLDRAKPPDIDLDIESERRGDVIAYVKSKFPTAVQIGTYPRIGLGDDEDRDGMPIEDDDRTGSLVVQYHAAMRRKDPNYSGRVNEDHWPVLEELAELDARKARGAHAAGFVLPGDDLPIDHYLATMLIVSSNTTVTQAPMDDVEDAGYMKGDFLGLRSLTTFRRCVELLGKDPVKDGMDWIPLGDKKAAAILRSGQADNGVFQFEGWSTAKGGREMSVQDVHDAIRCLALYRPAMMASGMKDRYLEARNNQTFRDLHPMLDGIVKDTWGVPVFQEQVLNIMKGVGLEPEDRNLIMKAVKQSNDRVEDALKVFNDMHPKFLRKCAANLDCSREEAELIWKTVMDFTDYGFNKAHATAYGLMAYRMAWLKAHHPGEFMAALLAAWTGTKKEAKYIAEAKRMKLTIGRPDVNKSDVVWTIDGNGVLRKGLQTIDGVGGVVAECIAHDRMTHGPFQSLEDMIDRLPARPVSGGRDYSKTGVLGGIYKKMADSGALKSLGINP